MGAKIYLTEEDLKFEPFAQLHAEGKVNLYAHDRSTFTFQRCIDWFASPTAAVPPTGVPTAVPAAVPTALPTAVPTAMPTTAEAQGEGELDPSPFDFASCGEIRVQTDREAPPLDFGGHAVAAVRRCPPAVRQPPSAAQPLVQEKRKAEATAKGLPRKKQSVDEKAAAAGHKKALL